MSEKLLNAILIDSESQTVKEIKLDNSNYLNISTALGCQYFAVVSLPNGDSLFVDDEGLLKNPEHFFLFPDYPYPLAGRGLILGCDYESGDSIDCKYVLEDFEHRIAYMNKDEVLAAF